MTWTLVRLGWGNISAIAALALLPLVSLTMVGPSTHDLGLQQAAKTEPVENYALPGPDEVAISPAS